MDDSWRQHKDLRQHYCVGSSFWCRPNIAFPNKRLPTRSCSSKVSMALARSWKSLSSFESIPGMLCIACLGRGWQNDPANHANLTLLPPNRSSFFDPNEFGPNSFRKSWTARARVTTSLMVQDTTSCQLLSASYLALGEDPQRQNVSGFCTHTKRHRRVNGKVAVSLKISTISNPNNTSAYWSLSWKARQIYLASHLTNKSLQRSQNDKTYPPQPFAKYLAQVPSGLNGSPAALYLWFTMHRAVSIAGRSRFSAEHPMEWPIAFSIPWSSKSIFLERIIVIRSGYKVD